MKLQPSSTRVRIDIHGPDGGIDVDFVDIKTPTNTDDLADWFDEHVYPHTDAGAGPAADGNGVTATATIVSSSCASLRDESIEWG